MTTPINLRMLSYLVALADERHFGRAAQACFVSQPTLSAQLKKLEELLGVVLVERRPRNVMLTEAGIAVVERARRMLADADEIVDIARASQNPLAGRLRIGLIPTLGPYLLPHIVAAVRDELPELECQYLEYQTDPLLEHLRDGSLDAGLLALPIDADDLEVRALFNEPFCLAVHRDNPLARRKTVSLADLDGEDFLLLEDGHCLRDQALEVCALAGIEEQSGFRATSLETLRQMVAAGAGTTLLPMLAVDDRALNAADVVTLRFRKPPPSRVIAIARRPTCPRAKAIDAFAGIAAREVPLTTLLSAGAA